MPIFAPFRVQVDPWEADYGSETPLEVVTTESDEQVKEDVELPSDQWKAIEPKAVSVPAVIYFVDGVRRLESRLSVNRDGRYVHGAFGSYAVGCVRVQNQSACFDKLLPGRTIVFGSNERPPNDVEVRPKLTYFAASTGGDEPDKPLLFIHQSMRTEESRLARELSENPDTLVVADGPLRHEQGGRGLAIGFIKRISRLYLAAPYLKYLATLPARQRTPVFGILAGGHGFARFSWYVRLAERWPGESDFHGLVRLEVHQAVGRDKAIELADLTTSLLPQFAPPRSRDPRSPQNLLPIGALENRLRRELGDQQLLRRWIAELVAKEIPNA